MKFRHVIAGQALFWIVVAAAAHYSGGLHILGLSITEIAQHASGQDQSDGREKKTERPSNQSGIASLFLCAVFPPSGTTPKTTA